MVPVISAVVAERNKGEVMQCHDIESIIYRRVNGGFKAAIAAARLAQDPDLIVFLKEKLTFSFNRSGGIAALKLAQNSGDNELMQHVVGLIEVDARAKRLRQLATARAKQQALIAKARRQGYTKPVLVYWLNERGVPKFEAFIEARHWSTPAWVLPAFIAQAPVRPARRAAA